MEPVFGQIKMRGLGRLSLRGLANASGEWALIVLTHNLLKLHKAPQESGSEVGAGPPSGRSPRA